MATFKLKNDSKDSGAVPGVGVYVDGVLENAPETFENPNFVKVETAAPAPAVASVAPVAPLAPAPVAQPAQAQPPTPTQENK